MTNQKLEQWIKCGENHLSKIDTEKNIIHDVILCELGEARGHYSASGLPLFFDTESINRICKLIKESTEEISLTLNHSELVESLIGRVILSTCKVVDSKVIADIELYKIAFDDCMNQIGARIIGLLESSNESLNISLEIYSEIIETEDIGLIRPFLIDCASIVMSGAATKTFIMLKKGKNNEGVNINTFNKEQEMPCENDEDKDEKKMVDNKEREVPETTDEDKLQEEEVKEEDKLQEEEVDKTPEETPEETMEAKLVAIQSTLDMILNMLQPESTDEMQEEEDDEEEKTKLSKKKNKPVQLLSDIEESDGEQNTNSEPSDAELLSNVRKYMKIPEYKQRILKLV